MTSPLSLPVLRQLLNEATPGEWSAGSEGLVITQRLSGDLAIYVRGDARMPDRLLAAAAVNHLPVLLDLVERQAAAIEAVQELVAQFDDQAEQNDETLRGSSPGAPWRDRHSGLRDAFRQAANDLRTALSGITPTIEETSTDER